MRNRSLLVTMARAFQAGTQQIGQVVTRGVRVLGKPRRWLAPLAARYLRHFAGRTRPRHGEVMRFLLKDGSFSRDSPKAVIADWVTEPQRMQPVAAARNWDLPAIESLKELADWLGITAGELEWFADLKRLTSGNQTDTKLRHYHYRFLLKNSRKTDSLRLVASESSSKYWSRAGAAFALTKKSGNIRVIEAPKPRLKELQRQILTSILEKIPTHSVVHGFKKGRSIQTFIAPHVGKKVVLRMDLQDFFPSISSARIQTAFRTMGYPESVADRLGGICTNATPLGLWKGIEADPRLIQAARALHTRRHLPQGSPASPALANLCTYRLDCRLTGLADAVGAEYTRYADDLAFSGDEAFERCAGRFSIQVAAILLEEGFAANHRKTRIMRQGVRQHLVGLVANQRVNVIRTDFDKLKAILNNCFRFGPQSQNREAHPNFRMHLDGRVGFVEQINPQKGKRLRTIFDKIQWT